MSGLVPIVAGLVPVTPVDVRVVVPIDVSIRVAGRVRRPTGVVPVVVPRRDLDRHVRVAGAVRVGTEGDNRG